MKEETSEIPVYLGRRPSINVIVRPMCVKMAISCEAIVEPPLKREAGLGKTEPPPIASYSPRHTPPPGSLFSSLQMVLNFYGFLGHWGIDSVGC